MNMPDDYEAELRREDQARKRMLLHRFNHWHPHDPFYIEERDDDDSTER